MAAQNGETARRSPRFKRGDGSDAICRSAVKVARTNCHLIKSLQYLFTKVMGIRKCFLGGRGDSIENFSLNFG